MIKLRVAHLRIRKLNPISVTIFVAIFSLPQTSVCGITYTRKMGWILEVAKMFMYISFPVGVYHYVNQPEYFDKQVLKVKQEHYPVYSKKTVEDMEEFFREVNIKSEKQRLSEMEKQQIQKQ